MHVSAAGVTLRTCTHRPTLAQGPRNAASAPAQPPCRVIRPKCISQYRDQRRTRARKGTGAPGTVFGAAVAPGSPATPPRVQGLRPGTALIRSLCATILAGVSRALGGRRERGKKMTLNLYRKREGGAKGVYLQSRLLKRTVLVARAQESSERTLFFLARPLA